MEEAAPTKRRKAVWTFSAMAASLLLVQYAVRDYYSPAWFAFDGMATAFYYGLFGVTCLVIIGSAMLKWTKETRRIIRLPVLIILVGAATSFLFHQLSRSRSNVPVIFSAYYDGDYNGTGIRLRTDGTYEIMDGSVLGSATLYGDYRLAGDTITIAREHFRFDNEHWRFGKRMVITPEGVMPMEDPTSPTGWSFTMRITQDDRSTEVQK